VYRSRGGVSLFVVWGVQEWGGFLLLWFEAYRSRGGSSYCGLRCTEVGVVPLIVG
jgi:hypothetical protein